MGAHAQMSDASIEMLDRDDVLKVQQRKLASLGERLAGSQEWREHFARTGLKPEDLADRQALEAVPTLEKSDLRELYPFPFLTVPMEQVQRFFATSGTTGLPILFGFTARDVEVLLRGQVGRILRAVGIGPGDRVYQGYGYGTWIGGSALDEGIKAAGATNFPIGPGRGELAVRWIADHGYTGCSISPLWMMTLIDIARRQGLDPKRDWKLKTGVFGGQSVSKAFKDELEAALPDGFMAHNIYGTTEAGGPILGVSCPYSHERDEMHLINEDTVLTEIVDPDTMKPVAPGESGEIVITTLDKEASPVVRWRTRDLVRLSERPHDCPCGRGGYPLIGRIIGRSDDMLKVRGVMLYPSQVEDIIAGTPGTAKEAWQIYIDREDRVLEEITVAVERRRSAELTAEQIRESIQRETHSRLGIRLKVECHDEGALPRYEAKAQRVHVRTADNS